MLEHARDRIEHDLGTVPHDVVPAAARKHQLARLRGCRHEVRVHATHRVVLIGGLTHERSATTSIVRSVVG